LKRELIIANGIFISLTTVLLINPPNLYQNNVTPVVLPISGGSTQIKTTNRNVSLNTSTLIKTDIQVKPTPTDTPISNPTEAPKPVIQAINGTFIGDAVDISYGNMQVKIVIQDNKIIDAQAVQYPNTGKSGELNKTAIATLRQETLAAQSANISAVSGASYTSYGWYKSLISAINKAGL
jgi:uncharacterized protein with FMN-binding domain